jgi:hypothetical protein
MLHSTQLHARASEQGYFTVTETVALMPWGAAGWNWH